ncbi:MAG: divergent PAP2 family protein [Oscillospiraceae bacterium]
MNTLSYNYVLFASLVSWCAAQVIKTLLNFMQTKKFNPERLFGAGGMPSSHSALVCSATIAVCRKCGFGSSEFAIMFIVAMIVMYDAMGVRRSAGLHAREINRINRIFAVRGIKPNEESQERKPEKRKKELKEYLGHTPFEVLGGALLGILIAMAMPMTLTM